MDNRPIGIFDSGVGGLTVLREIRRLLPSESTIYVGDTARVPYGAKTPDELLIFAQQIITFLLENDAKAVVIACGTSGSATYEKLTELYPSLPLVDVIRPGVDLCMNLSETENISRFGLIATAATIKSGLFAQLLHKKSPQVMLHSMACPLFASMVEAGLHGRHPAVHFAAESYLSDLKGKIDALVLGCTHYPLLTDALTAVLGDVKFVNIGEATALEAKKQLSAQNLLADENNAATHEFYVTGAADVFDSIGKTILGEDCTPKVIKL